MERARRLCFDRILPRDLRRFQRTTRGPGGASRAIAVKKSVWVNGSTITIGFRGATQEQVDMVQQIAPTWTEYANLEFDFTDDPRAKIRVTFDEDDGAWSYLGTDNLDIPLHAATLNLGWQDRGVILHEFGHMIGLAHEHQNPEGGIEWNEAAVIDDLSGPPNYWDEPTIRHNVLRKYAADHIHGTAFDQNSIMLYEFPDDWTSNRGPTHDNDRLSQVDKDFVRSAEMYPGRQSPDEAAKELQLDKPTEGAIEAEEGEDLYRLVVPEAGRYIVETSGSTDLVLGLFGPDSTTDLIARDDDGGVGLNARVVASVEPGTYYAQVRHYDREGTGVYSISARGI